MVRRRSGRSPRGSSEPGATLSEARIPIGSVRRRRMAKESTLADADLSIGCRRSPTGRARPRRESAAEQTSPGRPRAGPDARCRPAGALHRSPGAEVREFVTRLLEDTSEQVPRVVKDILASASTDREESTRYPALDAASTPLSHTVVLPMPGFPRTSRTEGESATPRMNRSTTRSSRSRPRIASWTTKERSTRGVLRAKPRPFPALFVVA